MTVSKLYSGALVSEGSTERGAQREAAGAAAVSQESVPGEEVVHQEEASGSRVKIGAIGREKDLVCSVLRNPVTK